MYQFACENKVPPMGAPFERFSCHYYDDQEEKAYSRLFGAGEALEKKAKGGMLFLDNVEYLPVGCREHLLDLIENDDAVLRDIILVCSLQDKARASVKDAYTARFFRPDRIAAAAKLAAGGAFCAGAAVPDQ